MIVAIKSERGRKLVPCADAARDYKCSMRWIRELAKKKRIYGELVCGSWLVDLADVHELAMRKATGRERKRSTGFKPG